MRIKKGKYYLVMSGGGAELAVGKSFRTRASALKYRKDIFEGTLKSIVVKKAPKSFADNEEWEDYIGYF